MDIDAGDASADGDEKGSGSLVLWGVALEVKKGASKCCSDILMMLFHKVDKWLCVI